MVNTKSENKFCIICYKLYAIEHLSFLANLPPEYKLANYLNIFSKEKEKTGKEKIVDVGHAKRTLENWATFNFPRSLPLSVTFFYFFGFFDAIRK